MQQCSVFWLLSSKNLKSLETLQSMCFWKTWLQAVATMLILSHSTGQILMQEYMTSFQLLVLSSLLIMFVHSVQTKDTPWGFWNFFLLTTYNVDLKCCNTNSSSLATPSLLYAPPHFYNSDLLVLHHSSASSSYLFLQSSTSLLG